MTTLISIIISALALVCSAIGIYQTYHQQKLANKHHLWDKRMKQYRILQGLMHSYQINIVPYLSYDDPIKDIADASDMLYEWLTNCETLQTFIPQDMQPFTEKHKVMINDLLHDSFTQIPVLWNEEISKPASKFISTYCDLIEALHHQALATKKLKELSSKSQPTKKEINKLNIRIQTIKDAYDECINSNVLSSMSKTFILEDNTILKQIKQWLYAPLNPTKSTGIKERKSIIDINDKRLSQLFKVCYISAPGFATALLTNATLTANTDIVVKYTIPAIITATAAVTLWIVKHALRAGQCYAYTEDNWENTIVRSNRTYQYALSMIKCALVWIVTVFLTAVIAPKYECTQVVMQWLNNTFTPTITPLILIGIMILRWFVNRSASNTKIKSACTQITYCFGLLWTTQVIWNL